MTATCAAEFTRHLHDVRLRMMPEESFGFA
jgi:hypothetical protein